MRRGIVLFFLTVYLFSATELSELLKMNVLLEHFSEHQSENKQLTFSTFLYMHYINHGSDNGDKSKDNKLPFHSDRETVNSFVSGIIIPPVLFSIPNVLPLNFTERKIFNTVSTSLKSSYLSTIWQPPQIA